MSTLQQALQQFEATEANIEKLEKLWGKIYAFLPSGPAFGAPPEYDQLCIAFRHILSALPAIAGFRVQDRLYEFDEIGRMHLDALEVGEIEAQVSVNNALEEQGKSLREYRFRLSSKRRELVRERILRLIEEVGEILPSLVHSMKSVGTSEPMTGPSWLRLKEAVEEIASLRGSDAKPYRWNDLLRHLNFGQVGDLRDIHGLDWPEVKNALLSEIYGEDDPVPVDVADLADVVAARPQGSVTSKLNWAALTDEDFERLMFTLISDTPGYENPQWLQHTHAADRGRDLSVTRVDNDVLGGTRRYRIIIQCKHWLSKSVALPDVSNVRSQMELWHPPRVDGLVIATTGRFTADAIDFIERHNQADRALHIGMWPDSHLERLLAPRPHLIGAFRLRSAT